ncbi:extracellular solute-binding protein [Acinetobacter sp. CUI P1]|nr:extracellular solute-binding protein [Acinetobacter sp. CUI P1]
MRGMRLWVVVVCMLMLPVITLLQGCSANNESDYAREHIAVLQDRVQISVMTPTHQLSKNLQDIPYLNHVASDANIHVNWMQKRNGWEEAKSTALTSGELPDAFLAGLTDQDIIANKDKFVDLSEYIDKYAPNIKRMFEEVPETKRVSTFPDGKMYSLPGVRPINTDSYNVLMINKKWLDKLGLTEPTTLDELREVLTAFRNGDPNGNGKQDELGMDWWAGAGGSLGSRGLFSVTSLLGAYGVTDNFTEEMIGVTKGQIRFLFESDEYKSLVSYLAKLWKEKLINPDVFTQDYSGMKASAQQDEVATVGVTFGWSLTDRVGKWADEYVALPPLRSSSNVEPLWPTSPSRVRITTNLFSMTTANPHPVETIQWIDQFYSEENSIQGYYGSIPDYVIKEPDGIYTIVPAPEGDQDTQQWTNALVDNGPLYFSQSLENKTIVPPAVTIRRELDSIYKAYEPKPEDIYPMIKFSSEELNEMALAKSDIFKLVDEKFAEWIMNSTVDKEWDQYINQLKQIGLPVMYRIYQQGYEDYYAQPNLNVNNN